MIDHWIFPIPFSNCLWTNISSYSLLTVTNISRACSHKSLGRAMH